MNEKRKMYYSRLLSNRTLKASEQRKLNKPPTRYTINTFKRLCFTTFKSINNKPNLLTFLKFILGWITLTLPALFIFLCIFASFEIHSNFWFLFYIITIGLVCALLILLFVFRWGSNCNQYSILIPTWSRINLFKVFNTVIFYILVWYFLMNLEEYFSGYPFMKEKVTQSKIQEKTSRGLNKGSFIWRIFFIFIFWDNNNNKNPTLGYFEFDDGVIEEFKINWNLFSKPVILISLFYMIKILLFRTKNSLIYFTLTWLAFFESVFFYFYPCSYENSGWEEFVYFKDDYMKYVEVIPILWMILLLIWLYSQQSLSKLFKNKFYIYQFTSKNVFTISLVIFLLIITIVSYNILAFLLIYALILDIKPSWEYGSWYPYFWYLFSGAFVGLSWGYSFNFGHYLYMLLYKPIMDEFCSSVLKNKYYKKCSNNLITKKKKHGQSYQPLIPPS